MQDPTALAFRSVYFYGKRSYELEVATLLYHLKLFISCIVIIMDTLKVMCEQHTCTTNHLNNSFFEDQMQNLKFKIADGIVWLFINDVTPIGQSGSKLK